MEKSLWFKIRACLNQARYFAAFLMQFTDKLTCDFERCPFRLFLMPLQSLEVAAGEPEDAIRVPVQLADLVSCNSMAELFDTMALVKEEGLELFLDASSHVQVNSEGDCDGLTASGYCGAAASVVHLSRPDARRPCFGCACPHSCKAVCCSCFSSEGGVDHWQDGCAN